MTTYNPDRFIPDTASDGPLGVDAHRVPVPPAEWGPGMLVRDPVHRGWQWTPPPDPRDRWEGAQPPVSHWRPVVVGMWQADSASPDVHCSIAVRECAGRDYVELAVSTVDVAAWSEPRPKPLLGSLAILKAQATYLRDALTAMLERVK